mgnify:CR=1 FL=1
MGDTRDVYLEPNERAVIRTADVYQTIIDDGVSGLFRYPACRGGELQQRRRARGFQRAEHGGEVQARRGRVEAVRCGSSPASGNACARRVQDARLPCHDGVRERGLLYDRRGKTFDEALAVSAEDVKEALDGVPWDKAHTPVFAVEGVRALVGDWLIRQGATLDRLNRELPCDEYSVTCMLCEHCSLRDSRIDLQVSEALAKAGVRA